MSPCAGSSTPSGLGSGRSRKPSRGPSSLTRLRVNAIPPATGIGRLSHSGKPAPCAYNRCDDRIGLPDRHAFPVNHRQAGQVWRFTRCWEHRHAN